MDFMDSGQPNSFSSTFRLQGKSGLIWNGKKQRGRIGNILRYNVQQYYQGVVKVESGRYSP